MRRILIAALAALLPAVGLAGARAAEPKVTDPGATCGNYGTSVHFVATPSEAARQALKEEKLVFVLHVSGLFEDPKFT